MKILDVIQCLSEIKNCLSAEPKDSEDFAIVKYLLSNVFTYSRASETISESDFEWLSQAFTERWNRIKFSKQSYTSPVDKNAPKWISLAKQLCDESEFDLCYLTFLMPSIENLQEKEAVSLETFASLPLNSLLVSDDGKRLISLSSAIANANANSGILAVYTSTNEHTLSLLEHKRFQSTNPILWAEYQQLCDKIEKDDGILVSKSTIYKLIELVERSVFENGVVASYEESEQLAAEVAYYSFQEYLNTLSHTEYDNLMRQVIKRNGSAQSFKGIWSMCMEEGACITWLARDIAQLILDYIPEYEFNNETISNWVKASKMRQQSQEKAFVAEGKLFKLFNNEEDYYKQQLLCLFSSIMTKTFTINFGGKKINYAGVRNKVSTTAFTIQQKIVTAFRTGAYLDAYFDIQNNILFEALNNRSYSRGDMTQEWLIDVFNGRYSWHTPLSLESYLALSLTTLADISRATSANAYQVVELEKKVSQLILASDNISENHKLFRAAIIFEQSKNLFNDSLDAMVCHVEGVEEKIKAKNIVVNRNSAVTQSMTKEKAVEEITKSIIEQLLCKFCLANKNNTFFDLLAEPAVKELDLFSLKDKCLKIVSPLNGKFSAALVHIYTYLVQNNKFSWSESALFQAKCFVSQYITVNDDSFSCDEFKSASLNVI